MTLSDHQAYTQVIGSLIHKPDLLLQYLDIQATDFDVDIYKIIFTIIRDLYNHGVTKMTPLEIDNEIILRDNGSTARYKKENGLTALTRAYDQAEVQNFDFYYKRIKKYALLRRLKKEKYDISDYYQPDGANLNPSEELIIQERCDSATLEDILANVEGKFNIIRDEFLDGTGIKESPAENIKELIEELKATPNYGPPIEGELFSAACRGAREGCFYLKSAASSAGKTRTSIFDACRICYPVRWSHDYNGFIREIDENGNLRTAQKTLFIITEMDKEEVQTIMLAYLSGVNEEHIISGLYLDGEEERVKFAADIIDAYNEEFFIAEISDPNLTNVSAVIKKHATVDKVKYVFYDYLHSTPSMIQDFVDNGINEATILMLMANQLKQLAKDYKLCLFSSTQVNMSAMMDTGEFKNETVIRASKAINDKADISYVLSRIGPKAWNELMIPLRQAVNMGRLDPKYINDEKWRPTHIFDIYKMRRGRFKNVRIWSYLDLGTGARRDLFITSADNSPISAPLLFNIYDEQLIPESR